MAAPILISSVTYAAIRDMSSVQFVDRGSQAVKGRLKSVHVYEVRAGVLGTSSHSEDVVSDGLGR